MNILRQYWSAYTRYLMTHEAGSIMLELFPETQKNFGGTAYIWGLYVAEPHRRKGIATMLLDQAEHIARKEGHDAVFLEWEEKNTPYEILQWYMRRGYDAIALAPHNCLLKKTLR